MLGLGRLLSYTFYQLWKAYKKTSGYKKEQLKYVLVSGLIGFAGGGTNYFLWYNIPIAPWGNPLVLVWAIVFSYIVLRYRFMDIKVILTDILVGAVGIILVILPFVMPTDSLRALTLAVFLLFSVFAYYLIKATHEEAKRRDEAERIAIQERALRESAEKLVKRERKLRLETERLSGARNQFLLSAQHYFRTPLTSLIGLLELMMTGSFGKEKLSQTFQSALELRKRIEEGLDISQFQSGKAILNKEEVQLEDLLLKTIEEFRPQLEQKPNLSFKINLSKEKLAKIKVDIKRIREVFSNLIDNALKHTLKGKVELFLEKIKEKNSILFKVKDTGIGIPKEELSYIGQSPFERGKEAKKLSPMGKGIGLYLSRLIVEAHGGKLWAESEGEGKGSTFYVELPIESEDEKK